MSHCDEEALLHGPETCPNHSLFAARARRNFLSFSGNAVRSYVIDRLFRDAAGERWVVDFKTSRHEGGGLEQFLDEQRARYEPQLNAYATGFDRAQLGLYFPLLQGWRQWSKLIR